MSSKAKFLSSILCAFLVAASEIAGAAEDSSESSVSEFPGLELLEFLGQFETELGEWMPPSELLLEEFETLLETAVGEETETTTDAAELGINN